MKNKSPPSITYTCNEAVKMKRLEAKVRTAKVLIPSHNARSISLISKVKEHDTEPVWLYSSTCISSNFNFFFLLKLNTVCIFWIVLICWCQKWFLKNKKNYWYIFQHEKLFKKQLLPHCQTRSYSWKHSLILQSTRGGRGSPVLRIR